ncbi:hypothetical protein [Pedobacter sp. SYSU D00535]|uniref:hypothetical protein n=1 Tax=Pedobacter sp. SYSU D00535 TaxID=2810308 RepID=UPI001A962F87|nr:hypothetical protein [Pedobacter sp. SYSU D00535]
MKTPEERNQYIKDKEQEIDATITDANAVEKPADDAFKTPNKPDSHAGEVPFEEQQFDDYDLNNPDTKGD